MRRVLTRIRLALLSITGRLFVSHILVAVLTSILVLVIGGVIVVFFAYTNQPAAYSFYAQDTAMNWLVPESRLITDDKSSVMKGGYSLVVSAEQEVLYVEGDTSCAPQDALSDCAPHLVGLDAGERFITIGGDPWIEVVLSLSSGDSVLARFPRLTPLEMLRWLQAGWSSVLLGLLQVVACVGFCSAPAGAILVWLTARPLLARLSRIANVSRAFAEGQFEKRVDDHHHDEVGQLAQQFDTMADTLQQNIIVLRDLLKVNAALTTEVERSAIQTERLRLSRDLHDDLAQKLFSLTAQTATLPGVIKTSAEDGVSSAQRIASLAEQTLLDLRHLLIDLRPGGLLEEGLLGSLRKLCMEWGEQHGVEVDVSLMVSSEQFPHPLQNGLYQITQESLSNIAKHAHAAQVAISLVEGRQQIVLSISDNGNGFTAETPSQSGHFGLVIMQERAQALGGTLFIESETGQGTTIRVVLPLHLSTE